MSLVSSNANALSATTSMNEPVGKKPPKQNSAFDKGQVVGLHRVGKSTKEVSQMTTKHCEMNNCSVGKVW